MKSDEIMVNEVVKVNSLRLFDTKFHRLLYIIKL